jgi:hypothetical protein
MIDTGNAKPIAVKEIMIGHKEMVIMCKSMATLAKVGHIRRYMTANSCSKPSLQPSHIRSIFQTLRI